MTDDKALTVHAVFDTREMADLAVEHLVQHQGIDRTDVFVEADGPQYTSGTRASGADVPDYQSDSGQSAPHLRGLIKVSADVRLNEVDATVGALRELGAIDVSAR